MFVNSPRNCGGCGDTSPPNRGGWSKLRSIWVPRTISETILRQDRRGERRPAMRGKESAGAGTPAPEPRLVSRYFSNPLLAHLSRQVKNFSPLPFPPRLLSTLSS